MSAAMSTPYLAQAPDLRTYRMVNVPMNAVGDAAIFTGLPSTPFVVTSVRVWNYSATPGTLTAFHIRDAAAGLGNSLLGPIAGTNLLITSTALGLDLVISNNAIFANRIFPGGTDLYFRVAVANIGTLTVNVNITVSVL